jgi:hypothetical protein
VGYADAFALSLSDSVDDESKLMLLGLDDERICGAVVHLCLLGALALPLGCLARLTELDPFLEDIFFIPRFDDLEEPISVSR